MSGASGSIASGCPFPAICLANVASMGIYKSVCVRRITLWSLKSCSNIGRTVSVMPGIFAPSLSSIPMGFMTYFCHWL